MSLDFVRRVPALPESGSAAIDMGSPACIAYRSRMVFRAL
jgi:hypothetical protein